MAYRHLPPSLLNAFRASRFLRALSIALGALVIIDIGLYGAIHHGLAGSAVVFHKGASLFKLTTWTCCFVLMLFIAQVLLKDAPALGLPKIAHWLAQSSRLFKINLLASTTALLAFMYLSTGTLSPYANTLNISPEYPLVDGRCHYLFNGDYHHFTALFFLLDGKSKQRWRHSVVLRRILYNCIAYPFMKLFEHDLGGLITNALLTLLAFVSFALFSLRSVGQTAAIAGMWLLAPYPGIHYYVGQPFLYALIVPGCLWLYMLVWKLHESPSVHSICIVSLSIGLLSTGYDFLPLFGPVALLLLIIIKRKAFIPAAIVCMLACTAVWWAVLRFGLHGTFASENSDIYANTIISFLHPAPLARWLETLRKIPEIVVANTLFSSFLFLPILFAIATLLWRKALYPVDLSIILCTLFIMLLNNCPPHFNVRWDMAGAKIARIYQPVFVALLFHSMRAIQTVRENNPNSLKSRLLLIAAVATILGNGTVALGPLCNDPCRISSTIYWRFYQHSPPGSMKSNLAKYGRRPWGFCR